MLGGTFGILAVVLVLPAGMRGTEPATSQQVDEILRELRQIRTLLENSGRRDVESSPGSKTVVDVKDAPVLGSENAAITIVEFLDDECPYCREFHSRTFDDLKRLYIDPGIVRFYVVDFPLDSHPWALSAAQAGRCATEQGKFWPLLNWALSERAKSVDVNAIYDFAREAKFDVDGLRRCVESGKYKQAIQDGMREASASSPWY
jgi:protein-disulfide isomerase